MGHLGRFTKTPYLVLFILLGAVGVGTASALVTISFEGLTVFKENAQFDKDVNIDGTLSGVQILDGLNTECDMNGGFVPTFLEGIWVCNLISGPHIATDAIDSAHINDNTIRSADINDGTIQSVDIAAGAVELLISTVDPSGSSDTSITAGPDGFPIMSYYASGGPGVTVLKGIHCTSVDCSTSTIFTFDGSDLEDGTFDLQQTSIAISGGRPAVAYQDDVNGFLKFVRCSTVNCSSVSAPITIDSFPHTIGYADMAIGSDGFPIMVHNRNDFGQNKMIVKHCTTVGCTGTIDSTTLVNGFSNNHAIAIGADTFPIISYNDGTNLKVIHCTTTTCSSSDTPTTLYTPAFSFPQKGTSIAINPDDDKAVILFSAFDDASDLSMFFVHCNNDKCDDFTTPKLIDDTGDVGEDPNIIIGPDGLAMMVYQHGGFGDLRVVHCLDRLCNEIDEKRTIDALGDIGTESSITTGSDGNPVMVYDGANGLTVAHCNDVRCKT